MASGQDQPTSDWIDGFLYDLLEEMKRSVQAELAQLSPSAGFALSAAITSIPQSDLAATVSMTLKGAPSPSRATVWSDGVWFGVALPDGLDVQHVDEPLGDEWGTPGTAEYNRSLYRAYADVGISYLSGRWERQVRRRALRWTETCQIHTFGHGVVTLRGSSVRSRPRSLNFQSGPSFDGA